jgi:hypothetical protein
MIPVSAERSVKTTTACQGRVTRCRYRYRYRYRKIAASQRA